ncbi:MAG: hypothetical protein ACYC4K_02090 [Thiobacillus sp.]
MNLKQLFVAVSLLVAGGNLLAQDAKTLLTDKPARKQTFEVVNKQSVTTDKLTIRKSSNPDRLDFIGVPWVNKDSK